MQYNQVSDLENPMMQGGRNSAIQANSSDGTMDEIQIHHRDEVLRRIQNFKENTSDFEIDPIPENGLGCIEIVVATILNAIGYLITLGCLGITGFYTVDPKRAVIFQVFGKIRYIKTEPGLYWSPLVLGRSLDTITTAIQTLQVNGSSVPDLNGSPMNVSAIVNFVITDPAKAKFAVTDLRGFIHNQAMEVIRNVCAQFLYRHQDPREVSLLSDSKFIGVQLKEILHIRCKDAGVDITRMELMEFSYHVEVAQSLLQVQQAQAKIDARKLIVDGSCGIVDDALKSIEKRGVELDDEDRADFAKKMMIITCSDHGSAMPVLNV